MDGKIFTVFLSALLSVSGRVSGWDETYRGAVLEYHPVKGATEKDTMLQNAKNFAGYMTQAKRKGADIIVFPEFGLFSTLPSEIPDPVDEIEPCTQNEFITTQAVRDLSCASKSNKIYSVVNLVEKRSCEVDDKNCPPRGFYIFNTNVVFDRSGIVRARYAKYNLFTTDSVDQPAEPEMSFFDTDFGVRFGTFICFDILFPAPAQKLVQQYQITDFVFSTYWFSELPFLTALQAQRGWAETNNVNLLGSGMNVPSSASSGSGIYNGKYGHIVQILRETQTTQLLVADIPKIKKSGNVCPREMPPPSGVPTGRHGPANFSVSRPAAGPLAEESSMLREYLTRFTTEVIKGGEKFERKICTPTNFCCDFKVTMDAFATESHNFTYRAVAYSGVRQFGKNFRGGAQTCGVVVCTGPKVEDCGNRAKGVSGQFKFKEIKIRGNFKRRNSFQMPSTLTEGKEFVPLPANKYEFARTEKDGSAEVSLELLWPVIDLHTFAIWGRDFTRDNEAAVPESNASTAVSMPVLLAAFISFLFLLR